MTRTRLVSLAAAILIWTTAALARDLPAINRFGEQPANPAKSAALTLKAQSLVGAKARVSGESRLGVPTFLWATSGVAQIPSAMRPVGNSTGNPEGAARVYLGAVASLYNLDSVDISEAPVRMIHDTGSGPVIVKMQQKVDGIEIFAEEVNVAMTQKLDLVAVSGYITSRSTPASARAGSLAFRLNSPAAAAAAVRDLTSAGIDASQLIAAGSRDGYDFFTSSNNSAMLTEPVRMKKVYYHMPDGLEPAYYIEVFAADTTPKPGIVSETGITDLDGYGYVISAVDGSVLFRANLSRDAQTPGGGQNNLAPGGFTYRVWADPSTGVPYDTPAGNGPHPKIVPTPDGAQASFVAPQDVTLPSLTFSQNDPWLAPGAIETTGNNVDAYLNLFNPDGITTTTPPSDPPTGDYRAQTTAAGQFLHTHVPDVNHSTAEARQGSIQQLFYNINFLHDWYYDSGFDEASGNAQTSNFGRGGLGADSIKAQVQDFAGFSNANMLTPQDGGRPRMRMYNFPNLQNHLEISAPAAIAGNYPLGISMSGPQVFDQTQDVVIATFSNSPSACTITNAAALAGKTAMFDFDNTDGTGCGFSTRIARITTTTTAVNMIMVYTSGSPSVVANISGFVPANTKPVVTVSWNTGQAIKGVIGGNTVTARLFRAADRDGSLDNQIVFHEWGHYLSNRLIGNAVGLNTNYASGMGEGWGDFSAMMLTVRENDTATASNSNWDGAYALATYATSGVPYNGTPNEGYYFGIRRYPYSTDMTKNPLTFKHIQNGVALPVGPPLGFGASGVNNAEVHNTGEVWATMLWECYAALLRDTLGPNPRLDFATAQARMKKYLVASLKLTPIYPTMLETRDAVLAAAFATDMTDFQEFSAAFAKRGAGLGAVSPDRFSNTNVAVTESFVSGADVAFVSAKLDDSNGTCDNDGVLDNNEGGKLTISIRNTGDQHLSATTATVTTTNPNVTIANGGNITFPASDPYDVVSATVGVSLTGAAGAQTVDLAIAINDPSLLVPGPRNATAYVSANTNSIPASSATDTVEAATSTWTTSGAPILTLQGLPWSVKQDAASTNHTWYAPDAHYGSDQYLVSPVFTVNGGGSVNLQFDHSFAFEFDGGGNYDGGAVEFSVNGGAFTDMGTAGGLPNYNGTVLNYTGTVNAIAGRPGFVQNSGGTIHSSFTKAVAPGSTVQVRFRVASDNSVGAAGWTIDNIQMNGVVETPFATIVADPGCNVTTATSLSVSANPSPFGASLTLTANISSTRGAAPGGTVTFFDGVTNLGTSPVAAGVATLSTSALTAGSHTLTAAFSGTAGFLGSTSSAVAQTIGKAATTTVLTATANPSPMATPITFFATVTSSTGGTPAGSVQFYDGASLLSTVALNGSGVATWSTVSLTPGPHSLSAVYLGNANYSGSTGLLTEQITSGSQVDLDASTYWKIETGGSIAITVTRSGGNNSAAATVDFTTTAGTAVAGVRYTTTTGTVNFAGGELVKVVNVPLINTTAAEGAQTFTFSLSNPVGTVLGTTTSAVVTITDDDVTSSDFSNPADGKVDILWRNTTTGDLRAWQMNGTTFVSSTDLPGFGTSWTLCGTGDFNNDGHADMLWRNDTTFEMQVAYMNGTTVTGSASVTPLPDVNWQVVAIGDMNGDGFPDILWRNSSTFQLNVWLMHDAAYLSTVALPTVPDANWKVIGLGDFTRDKKLDIVWRNNVSTDCAIWQMNGTTFVTGTFLPKVGAPWSLVGIGDMNGDGDADMLWRASTTNTIAVWQMNQTALGTFASFSGINDANWKFVSPR